MSQISRLKTAEISNGNVINADDIEAELDGLVTESNSQDTRLTTIESGTFTQSGTLITSNNIQTNGISERTAGSGVTIDGLLIKDAGLTFTDAGELTIATGAITATGAYHTIDTESDAASDDLDTINGGVAGRFLIVQAENDARTVVLKHNTGNIYNPAAADVTLDDDKKIVILLYSAALSKWVVTGSAGSLDSLSDVTITGAASGQVLGYNGSAWVNIGGGMVLLAQDTASNDASIEFTSGLSSTYDHYIIEIVDLVPQTDNTNLLMTVSNDGGSSYLAGTNYEYYGRQMNATDTETAFNNAGTTSFPLNGTETLGNDSDQSANFHIDLYAPASAKAHRVYWRGVFRPTDATALTASNYVGGHVKDTSAINAIKFAMSSGNITSGGFRLYGVVK